MTFKDKRILIEAAAFKVVLMSLFLGTAYSVNAQITNGTIKPEDEKEDGEKNKTERPTSFSEDSLTGTDFYITGLYQYTYRAFEDQSAAHFYKEWESQTASYHGGFNLGMIMKLTRHFHLDIGISYFGNGENYSYQDSLTDSTYTYQNNYRQLAIPIRLRFSYGNKLQVFGFAGIAPLNILRIKYESSYTTALGQKVERDPEIERDGFATFNLMATVGAGIQYNLRYVGFTIYPEYRRHLLNTYSTKTISMDHKMYGFAINAGMVLRF